MGPRFALSATVGLVAALVVTACSAGPTPDASGTAEPLPGGARPTESITLAMIEPDDGVQPVVDFIDAAERTLDIAVYQLDPTYKPLRTALRSAVDRGVAVRVLLSRRIYPPGTPNENPADTRALRGIGVASRLSSDRYSYSHWKTLVRDAGTDGEAALVADFNLEASYFGPDPAYPKEGGTRGMAALVTDEGDIAEIRRTFRADWPPYSRPPEPTRANLVWAPSGRRVEPPGNAAIALTSLISGAHSTIDAYIQELPVPAELLDPLLTAARSGVSVRIIGNKGGMDKSEGPLTQAGAQIRYGPQTADGKAMYIHSKTIIVDGATDRGVAFIGSENPFVNMSLNSERELGVLLTDAPSRSRIEALFEGDFGRATPS